MGELLTNVKVFWINLDRCPERRAFMEMQLHGCDALRIPAVDARTVDVRRECQTLGLGDADRSPAELGCLLSHLKACRAAKEAGAPLSLVLEDDASLEFATVPLRTLAAAAPDKWTVLQLACNNAEVQKLLAVQPDPFSPWTRSHWGAGAYLVSREGAAACADAAALRATLSPRLQKLVADEAIFWRPGAYTYGRPFVITEEFVSTIQSDDHMATVQGASRAFSRAYFAGERPEPVPSAALPPCVRDPLCWKAVSRCPARTGPEPTSAFLGDVAPGGVVVLAGGPLQRVAKCVAPVDGYVDLAALEPWGSLVRRELEDFQRLAPGARYWPFEEEDPWAAGAYLAQLPAAVYALQKAEAAFGRPRELSAACPRMCDAPVCAPADVVKGRVSVLCPTTSKRRKWHALLLANFRRQTWKDVELIVYDDGPEPSPMLRRAEDIIYVHSRANVISLGEKRNRLLAMASGEYVANFDDDNVYAAEYLAEMVRHLEDSGASLVSLTDAWVATRADAEADDASARCRRLGGFGSRGETFVHRNLPVWYADIDVGEESGLLRGVAHHAVVDDVGVFLHVEHGANTVAFELCDARGAVGWDAVGGSGLPPTAPLRKALPLV